MVLGLDWAYSCICDQLLGQLGAGESRKTSAEMVGLFLHGFSWFLQQANLLLSTYQKKGPKKANETKRGPVSPQLKTGTPSFSLYSVGQNNSKARNLQRLEKQAPYLDERSFKSHFTKGLDRKRKHDYCVHFLKSTALSRLCHLWI